MIFNPCFIKQTKARHYICSCTLETINSTIGARYYGFYRFTRTGAINFCDYESYCGDIISNNSIMDVKYKKWLKIEHSCYNDK